MAGYTVYSLDWSKFQQFIEHPTPEQLAVFASLVTDALEEKDEFGDDPLTRPWPKGKAAQARLLSDRLARPDWYGDLSEAGRNLWESVIFDVGLGDSGIDLGFRVDSDGVYWDVVELAWKHLQVASDEISEVAFSAFGKSPFRYFGLTTAPQTRDEHAKEETGRPSNPKTLRAILDRLLDAATQEGADQDEVLAAFEADSSISDADKEAIKALFSDDDPDDEGDELWEWQPMHSMHTPDEVQRMLAELISIDKVMRETNDSAVREDYEELLAALTRIAKDHRLLFVQVDT